MKDPVMDLEAIHLGCNLHKDSVVGEDQVALDESLHVVEEDGEGFAVVEVEVEVEVEEVDQRDCLKEIYACENCEKLD